MRFLYKGCAMSQSTNTRLNAHAKLPKLSPNNGCIQSLYHALHTLYVLPATSNLITPMIYTKMADKQKMKSGLTPKLSKKTHHFLCPLPNYNCEVQKNQNTLSLYFLQLFLYIRLLLLA